MTSRLTNRFFPEGNGVTQRRCWILCLVCCVFATVVLTGQETRAKTVKAGNDSLGVDQLALQLGDESFAVREHAMDELWKLGSDALPALRKVQVGDDIEASERATELIGYISVGLLYDSPAEVKAMVMRFFQSNEDGKIIMVHKLISMDQWRQVMALAKREKNAVLRGKISQICWRQKLAPMLRLALAKGDQAQVDEIFSLVGDIDYFMRVRAFYYGQTGKLSDELGKAAELTGQKAAKWRMWLHRVDGNMDAATTEALNAKLPVVADLLRVLDGDPVPYLERSAASGDDIYSWGCKLQLLRLAGKEEDAQALSRQWQDLARDDESRQRVMLCLAMNGFREQALELFETIAVYEAIAFYDVIEMPLRSLKLLGIPENARAAYEAWVAQRLDKLDDENTRQEILMLAGLLNARGEEAQAREVILPMMTRLAMEDESVWSEQIKAMVDGDLSALAIGFIRQRMAVDDVGQEQMVDLSKEIFGSMPSESIDLLWDHLMKRKGDTPSQVLEELAMLAGLLPDPDNRVPELHRSLQQEAQQQDGAIKDLLITAIYQLCLVRGDITTASQMMDALAAEGLTLGENKNDLDFQLQRWELIEPVLAANVENRPADWSSLIKWHIALLKLGQSKQAAEIFSRAMIQTLGDPALLTTWGVALHDAGYESKAADLWFLAAAMSNLENDSSLHDYRRAISSLANWVQPLYRSGQWQKALAMSEMAAHSLMSRHVNSGIHTALRVRYQAEFCRGMEMLRQGRQAEGLRSLERAHSLMRGDGVLADDFFPALRQRIPEKTYNRWFEQSYALIEAACADFPRSHNSHNTAAWLAARAVRKLDEAHAHAEQALQMRPHQGAYLDTMAEVWFSRGERQKALMWSQTAIAASISKTSGSPRGLEWVLANYQQLNKQLHHFKNDPLPNKPR